MGSATALSKVLICVHCTRIFSDNPWRNQWTNPHSNGIGLKIPLSLGILMYTLAAFLIDAITTGLLLKTSSGLITRSMAILQLRIMAPCVTLACLMGIGCGSFDRAFTSSL
ncbi:uncharacterized protein LOC9643252 isoform X2 [Selaginella moellendorffii]|uniref:uncharacterized protein LOC9643252 isoform X2 n=1 Tax=Selaginella moellendorffii TaxID=88036 RepID=UPI000D1CAFF7|nr:uncharacterized protein LOC9643252 isoform X2 [Selaginella moellendorffii]|eukprot:XP_024545084.1 uncharacterized protein LOC9643252 isoform X2 [Selaginella moellendorffii]